MPTTNRGKTLDESERHRRHFNASAPACRYGNRPQLDYEPGCWRIACGETCRCQILDGSHASPGPLLLRWQRER